MRSMRGFTDVTIGGILFESIPDDRHDAYVFDKISGLDEGVDVRLNDIARPDADGDFDIPSRLGTRLIVLSGNVVARTPEELVHKVLALRGLIPAGRTVRLEAVNVLHTVCCDVKWASKPMITIRGADACTATFQVQVKATNPRLYGDSERFEGISRVTVSHRGNTAASPLLTVSGVAASGYTVSAPGGQITITRALAVSAPHVIDMTAAQPLRVGGSRVLGGIGTWRPFVVEPGAVGTQIQVTGGLRLQVEMVDTYI